MNKRKKKLNMNSYLSLNGHWLNQNLVFLIELRNQSTNAVESLSFLDCNYSSMSIRLRRIDFINQFYLSNLRFSTAVLDCLLILSLWVIIISELASKGRGKHYSNTFIQCTDLHCKSSYNISLHFFGILKFNQLEIKVFNDCQFSGYGEN